MTIRPTDKTKHCLKPIKYAQKILQKYFAYYFANHIFSFICHVVPKSIWSNEICLADILKQMIVIVIPERRVSSLKDVV